jgi:hypothetical protein
MDGALKSTVKAKTRYSGTRVAVPTGNSAKWLFPQEKATSNTFGEGMFTLVSL